MPISADYDREADALYVRLHEGDRDRAVEINETTYVDLDADGRAIGIELLYPSQSLDLDPVGQRFALAAQIPEIIAAISETDAPIAAQTMTTGQHLASTVTIVTLFEGTVVAGGETLSGSVSRLNKDEQTAGCLA